jgi:nonribosomal peptide synthetase DhbF
MERLPFTKREDELPTTIMVINERIKSLPLSAAQFGIWFEQRINPANSYSISLFSEIQGPIDPNLFLVAARQAIMDTETLRVRLIEEVDGPRQVIDPVCEISIPLLDVSLESDPKAVAEAWMKSELAQPVDLLRGPLRTFALFQAGPDRFFWYHRSHHIIMDGFGAWLFARRVVDLYSALANGLPCGIVDGGETALGWTHR